MKMVRKQVYITWEQDARLKASSERLGVSEAELMRQGIDLVGRQEDVTHAARVAAWNRLKAMIDDHVSTRPKGSGIAKFDRDEVYAERLDRPGAIPG
jgi:Ribbon-helix-helix domain